METAFKKKLSLHFFETRYLHLHRFFHTAVQKQQIHLPAMLTISFLQALWINAIADMLAVYLFCYQLPFELHVSTAFLLIFINHRFFFTEKHCFKIIQESSVKLSLESIIVSLLFVVLPVSWLFWGPQLIKVFPCSPV